MGGVHEVASGVLSEADRLIVDDFDYAVTRGDMGAWIAAGDLTREQIAARLDADIGEVMAGLKPGRQGDREKVLAVIQGMAICDIAMAKLAIDKANEKGIGISVDL